MSDLIIGGSGFFGSNLSRRLRDRGSDFISLDRYTPQIDVGQSHKFIDLALDDISYYLKWADTIYYLAGQTSHARSVAAPLTDQHENLTNLLAILEVMRRLKHKPLLVYPSSTSLYGLQNLQPINETARPQPVEIYSLHKLTAEHYIDIYRNHGFIRGVILRFPNCFGPFGHNQPEFGVLNYWISQVIAGKPVVVYGDGEQHRTILFIKDAIDALLLAPECQALHRHIWNVADYNGVYQIKTIAAIIAEIFGQGVVYTDWPEGRKTIEIGDAIIDGSKFRNHTNWSARYSLVAGLQRMSGEDSNNGRVGSYWQRVAGQ